MMASNIMRSGAVIQHRQGANLQSQIADLKSPITLHRDDLRLAILDLRIEILTTAVLTTARVPHSSSHGRQTVPLSADGAEGHIRTTPGASAVINCF
jgi:hypothetical protein